MDYFVVALVIVGSASGAWAFYLWRRRRALERTWRHKGDDA